MQNSKYRKIYAQIFALGIAFTCCSMFDLIAKEQVVSRIQIVIPEGFYIDAGKNEHLAPGMVGIVTRGGRLISKAQIERCSPRSSLLTSLDSVVGESLRVGDVVKFTIVTPARTNRTSTPPEVKRPKKPRNFTPLLAPDKQSKGLTTPKNLSHGRIWFNQDLQVDSNDGLRDYSISRLGTRGSVERLKGSLWSINWYNQLSYRDGDVLENSDGFNQLRFDLYRLSIQKRYPDDSLLRFGRFLPHELPQVGYLDGTQGEKVLMEGLRLGSFLGFKPDRDRLSPSIKEPLIIPYLRIHSESDSHELSSTTGVLSSLYEGKVDRVAFIAYQSLRLGSNFYCSSTSEIDFDVGNMEHRDGVQLTRWNAYLSYFVLPNINIMGGIDRYQPIDIRAERDSTELIILNAINENSWRYWIGSTQNLFWGLRLHEEISWVNSSPGDDLLLWNVSLSKYSKVWFPSASLTVSIYNLDSTFEDGYGGHITAYLPLFDHKLSFQASLSTQWIELGSQEFDFRNLTFRANWQMTQKLRAHLGMSYGIGDDVERVFVDVGLSFTW